MCTVRIALRCRKGLLSKKVYRSYKEYYEVTLKEAIETIKKCIKLSGSTLMSEDKYYLDYKMSRSTALNGFQINVNNYNEQNEVSNGSEQNGGSNSSDFNSYNSSLKMYIIYNHVINMIKDKDHEINPVNNLFNKLFIK
jgi:hypothetical protein